jgi:uncharacterized protein
MDIKTLLESARTIAVVGCSPRGFQVSHRIAQYMQDAGYDVIPVNPQHDEILGVKCYPDVASIPEDVQLDIVNVFRRPQFTREVVEDVAARVKATGQKPVIWTQVGVHSEEARQRAERFGLPYVANHCIMIDHARYATGRRSG